MVRLCKLGLAGSFHKAPIRACTRYLTWDLCSFTGLSCLVEPNLSLKEPGLAVVNWIILFGILVIAIAFQNRRASAIAQPLPAFVPSTDAPSQPC